MSTLTIIWPDKTTGKNPVDVSQTVRYNTTEELVNNINAVPPQQGITISAGYGIAVTSTSAYVYITSYAAAPPKSGRPMTLNFTNTFSSSTFWVRMSTSEAINTNPITFNVGDGIITSDPVDVELTASDLE